MIYEVKGGFIRRWLRSIFFECLEEMKKQEVSILITSDRDPSIYDVLPTTGAQWKNVRTNTTHILTKIEAKWEPLGDNKCHQQKSRISDCT